MKTIKHNLCAVAMGVALATASLSASATPTIDPGPAELGVQTILQGEFGSTAPTFNRAEQTGLCLMESVVSLLASRTNDFNCDTHTYALSVFTTDNQGVGQAEIDLGVNVGGTTLNAVLGPTKDIGTRCKVDDAQGLNLLKGVEVVRYDGAHGWSRSNEIFNSDGLILLRDPQTQSINRYKEVDIKDFFKYVVDHRSWELDWGLEDIKKFRFATRAYPFGFHYPVQKWVESSFYQHENGQEGQLQVYKNLVIPRSARGCQIHVDIPVGGMFNGSGEFQADGTVTVGRHIIR
ncbi:MAG: hypothetical protein ACU88J_03375 [Gammaproteobacteria bacterium]